MGNDQSSSSSGISTSFSFLSGRKGGNSSFRKKTGQIVVVRSGSSGTLCSEEDISLKKFKEIPKFYPILKSALHQNGLHDSPDIKKKISSRAIFRLATCFQDYFGEYAQLIASEQGYIASRIKDVDYFVTVFLDRLVYRKKSLEVLQLQSEKLSEVKNELENLKMRLEDLLPQVRSLNEFLPEEDRLPPLSLIHLFDSLTSTSTASSTTTSGTSTPAEDVISPDSLLTNLQIEPIEECYVVDK
uniref:BLOC-1-related complex subunit 5 n=1 Tax=Syphacia muris TaxID=451379 RepID=A0A0N5AK77_9BILA